jgi:hypothetical protein
MATCGENCRLCHALASEDVCTKGAPLLADLFLYSYEYRGFSRKREKK